MKAKSLEIHNLKGISDIRIEVGTLVLIAGANGTGKSSILDSVLTMFEGGCDPGLLRIGESKGFVRLMIEDDSGRPISIQKTIYRAKKGAGEIKATLEIIGPDSPEPIPAPQSFINGLADSLAVNPAAFLNLKAKEAADELLRVLPISFDRREVEAVTCTAVGGRSEDLSLPELRAIADDIYAKRKRANADWKQYDASAKTFRQGLPAAKEEKDWDAEVADLEARAGKAQDLRQGERDKIRVRALADERRIKEEAQEKLSQLRAWENTALAEVEVAAEPVLKEITAALATAKEKARAQQRAAGAVKEIDKLDKLASAAAGTAEALGRALDKLKALEAKALADLPIPGLSYDGDQFYVDGVPLDHLNHAARIDLALQIRVLRGGDLKMFIIDGCESLDTDGMEALKSGAEKLGYQVLAAAVDSPRPPSEAEPDGYDGSLIVKQI